MTTPDTFNPPAPPANPPANVVGIVGLVISILGILTLGLLSPIAFIVSLIGVFKPPRVTAIIGLVLSFVGGIELLVVIAAAIFLGGAASQIQFEEVHRAMEAMEADERALRDFESTIPADPSRHMELPEGMENMDEVQKKMIEDALRRFEELGPPGSPPVGPEEVPTP